MAGSWLFWALLSAGFAVSTAILAKVGIAGINTDLAIFGVTFLGENLSPIHRAW